MTKENKLSRWFRKNSDIIIWIIGLIIILLLALRGFEII